MFTFAAAFCCCMMQACGFTSNMTDQEAYDFGYQIGSSIRSMIDN